MKLWQKEDTETAAFVESFTVGSDAQFDLLLAPYDVQGTRAHAQMLCSVGLLSEAELAAVLRALDDIENDIRAGKFVIDPGVEDVHSQVEFLLTQRLGDAGKKIHTGRSRNDQVAVDIKLYLRDAVLHIKAETAQVFETLLSLSDQYEDVLMPGYTHLQIAMPSSFGLWLGAYAESFSDDLDLLAAAYRAANKNPLGSGAGYGSSFPLNRTMTTELLHFGALHNNSVYAQMSRGKTEKTLAVALAGIAATAGRLAMDICLYTGQNFDFLHFPDALTTGSSIMPHKKNPDIFELIRARCSRIQSVPNELALLLNHLPSGYHRDVQLTKEILFPAITSLLECLQMLHFALPQMIVRTNILDDPRYQYLFTVEAVNELVQQGAAFRDAYRTVGEQVAAGNFSYQNFDRLTHTHEGSMGNLRNDAIRASFSEVVKQF